MSRKQSANGKVWLMDLLAKVFEKHRQEDEKNDRPNWFEIHVKKEKQFHKAINDIDAKMNLIIRTMGELEKTLMKKMEYLEHKIDSFGE